MATAKAKKSPVAKAKAEVPSAKAAAPSKALDKPKAPKRTRPIQVIVRLSAEEKRDLDEVVAQWESAAAEKGFSGKGIADWLRAIIRRERRKTT